MLNIKFSPEFIEKAQAYTMIHIEADVANSPTPLLLAEEMNASANWMANNMKIEDINKRPGIAATRAAYKRFGKEPNRYRPSQEQLCRRVIKGMGLYQVNAIVDLGNFLSLKTGCSLGIFDMDKIQGDTITMGAGREGEDYVGIGRGNLNIANLPIQRDAIGGIGTPTSDNERTCVDMDTKRILMTIHLYGDSEMTTKEIEDDAIRLLKQYASAQNITCTQHSI